MGHDGLAITVRSEIPVARARLFGRRGGGCSGGGWIEGPAVGGSAVDGHPENAAASVVGGLVAATTVGEARCEQCAC